MRTAGFGSGASQKKTKRKALFRSIEKGRSVGRVCRLMGRSRQSYYKALHSQKQYEVESKALLELVLPIRHQMPRIGGKKLYYLLGKHGCQNALKLGRDRFFSWLRQHELLIRPKRNFVYTTNSHHRFRVHKNLIQGLNLSKPNQVWVSDITYVRTLQGFCYLALITDAYSRKIVGYDISDSLELNGCISALTMALKSTDVIDGLIHHSDRGIQYCSNQYTALLQQNKIRISMAAQGNCYENALAERVNGILKNEFNIDSTFKNKEQAKETVIQAIYIYNQHRPHWALELQTPNTRHAA